MRIIAGTHRGRKLKAPPTELTRPITDRAKQSVFDILAPYLLDATVFDCFAGTGSMGIESLSRGARLAVFFEQERGAAQLLQENLTTFGMTDRAQIVSGDLFGHFAHSSLPSADVIFLDPPYRFLSERASELRALADRLQSCHMHNESLLVCRHDAADALALPGLEVAVARTYGQMIIEIFRKADG